MLYFAYASNMNFIQMKRWCPGSRFVKTVFLERQRFVYDGYSETWDGAVGNMVGADRERVWGALFEITVKDRLSLDAFEGYPRNVRPERGRCQGRRGERLPGHDLCPGRTGPGETASRLREGRS